MAIILVSGTIATKAVYTSYAEYSEIQTYNELQQDYMLPTFRAKVEIQYQGKTYFGFGSGVVVYSQLNELGTGYDTYIITCNHVVETPVFDESVPADPFAGPKAKGYNYGVKYVEFFDKFGNSLRKVPARVIAHSNNMVCTGDEDGNMIVDRKNADDQTGMYHGEDVALLKIETPEKYPVCKMPTRETLKALKVFDKVRVVGAALGDKPIPTFGEITRIDVDFVSVNAPAIFGNSGGPVFLDKTHELIGILNMGRATQGGFVTHMGFIRPLGRIYDWFDTVGYTFLYDKSVTTSAKFAIIRKDADTQRLQSADEKKIMLNKIATLEAYNARLDKFLKEVCDKIAQLDNAAKKNDAKAVDEIKKEIAALQQEIRCLLEEIDRLKK